MNLKNQRPVIVPAHYSAEIEQLSKAALMDIAWSFAIRCSGQEESQTEIMREFRRERDTIVAVRKAEIRGPV